MGDGMGEIYNDDDYVEVGEALDFAHYLIKTLKYKERPTRQEVRDIFEEYLTIKEDNG